MSSLPQQSNQSLTSFNAQIEANKKNGYADLSDRKKAFAFAYLESYSIAQAAKACDVSSETGQKWYREPLLNAYIADVQAEYQQRSIVNADFVRVQWLKLLPKVMGEEDVELVTGQGEPFVARKFDASAATKVLTELGKSTKFYEGGSGNGGNVSININLDALGISGKDEKVINHE